MVQLLRSVPALIPPSTGVLEVAHTQLLASEVSNVLAQIIAQSVHRACGEELVGRVSSTGSFRGLQVDLEKKDQVGPDPFLVRTERTSSCQVSALPNPLESSEMEQYLEKLDKTGLGPQPYRVRKDSFPGLINYIWVGSQLKDKTFRANVEDWRKQYSSFEIVIWTDQTKFDEEMLAWCRSNGVRLINIDEAIPESDWMCVRDYFSLCMSKMRPNFGEASDILRYVLLYHFGGIYVDTDTKISYVDHDSLDKTPMGQGFVLALESENLPECNDCFAARPKQPFFAEVCRRADIHYEMTLPYLLENASSLTGHQFTQGKDMAETLSRTGPGLVQIVFTELFEKERRITFKLPVLEAATSTCSWVTRSRLILSCPLEDHMVKGILTELLWDLKNEPKILNLNKFEAWIERAENPNQFRRELYLFVKQFYPKLLENVTQIEVKDPALFDDLCSELNLDPSAMGEAFIQAVILNHLDMAFHLIGINTDYIDYKCKLQDDRCMGLRVWELSVITQNIPLFDYVSSLRSPDSIRDLFQVAIVYNRFGFARKLIQEHPKLGLAIPLTKMTLYIQYLIKAYENDYESVCDDLEECYYFYAMENDELVSKFAELSYVFVKRQLAIGVKPTEGIASLTKPRLTNFVAKLMMKLSRVVPPNLFYRLMMSALNNTQMMSSSILCIISYFPYQTKEFFQSDVAIEFYNELFRNKGIDVCSIALNAIFIVDGEGLRSMINKLNPEYQGELKALL